MKHLKFFPDGTYYGELDEKKQPHGQGRFIYRSGGTYAGQWKHGKADGPGKMTWKDKTVFSGTFTDDLFDGFFVCTFSDGSVFKGNIVRGQLDEKGGMSGVHTGTLINSYCVYEGSVNAYFRPNGPGTMKFHHGAAMTGIFLNGHPMGYADVLATDGAKVRTYYDANGRRNGPETITWENGDVYVGEYKNDRLVAVETEKCILRHPSDIPEVRLQLWGDYHAFFEQEDMRTINREFDSICRKLDACMNRHDFGTYEKMGTNMPVIYMSFSHTGVTCKNLLKEILGTDIPTASYRLYTKEGVVALATRYMEHHREKYDAILQIGYGKVILCDYENGDWLNAHIDLMIDFIDRRNIRAD